MRARPLEGRALTGRRCPNTVSLHSARADQLELIEKLEILADAAKYDASCASSGAPARASDLRGGLGATTGMGICHSFTPDGRCVSLLKVLLTNVCIWDCGYCVNRRSSDVPRARFTPEELAQLTADFYKRNYIDGLFLSSGIVKSPDHTMEELIRTVRLLREQHEFRGYVHLKTIPDASEALIAEAGRWADRLSVNVELPTEGGLARLAPEKKIHTIKLAMGRIRLKLDEAKEAARDAGVEAAAPTAPVRFAPSGQSTQMIVGADGGDDRAILTTAQTLYGSYGLKRVYYSAFSPIPKAAAGLPAEKVPILREHRLYQADWLLRHYGFGAEELFENGADGHLPFDVDPKLAWALSHRERFPVDVNRADPAMLLRVPGLGARNVKRIVALRRHRRVRWEDLRRLRVSLDKARPFLVTADARVGAPPALSLDSAGLRQVLAAAQAPATQLPLF